MWTEKKNRLDSVVPQGEGRTGDDRLLAGLAESSIDMLFNGGIMHIFFYK